MEIDTRTYSEIYNEYTEAVSWMVGLGINIGSGRMSHYENVIKYWKNEYATVPHSVAKEKFPDFLNCMHAIHDFILVHNAFSKIPKKNLSAIIEKLQKAVYGPIKASEETRKSTSARNYLFEAVVAARSHRPADKVEAILNARSDTGIKVKDRKLWVECKRLLSQKKIERNVKNATNQLEVVLNSQHGSGHRGIVALDISKLFDADDKILVKNNDAELIHTLDQILRGFINQYSSIWHNVYAHRNKKIIGTIIRFSVICSSESRNLMAYASHWGLNPRHSLSNMDDITLRYLVSVLDKSV